MATSITHRGWKLPAGQGYLAALYNGTEAYRILGTGIDFVGTTLTPDSARADIALAIGTRATEKDITMAGTASEHLEPIQINLNFIGTIPTSTSTVNVMYMQLTHDTTDMTDYLRLKGTDWTFTINKDLQDAYVFQGEIDFGSGTNTIGGEAACLGMTMNSGTGTLTGNRWCGVFVTTGSANTTACLFLSHRGGTLTHSIYIEANSGQTITNAIYINEAGTVTNFAKFAAAKTCIVASDNAMTTNNTSHAIRIAIGGSTYYIPVFDTSNWG
ncbi:hypothetical protein LCGC14_0387720 [marine sediment metagenome]|uniref:Uncharacterized protein n=1 Tax=marine sediment metagenome TaxID=412755 RepID=A0A0F9T0H0_9ZZZZ